MMISNFEAQERVTSQGGIDRGFLDLLGKWELCQNSPLKKRIKARILGGGLLTL
jgi:hypothetical protein